MTAPDETFTHAGVECARWGQCVVPVGDPVDPVPAVYSTPTEIEIDDLRMDFATAEALIERLRAAIAYERGRATDRGAA
jgi:hypothetical protein